MIVQGVYGKNYWRYRKTDFTIRFYIKKVSFSNHIRNGTGFNLNFYSFPILVNFERSSAKSAIVREKLTSYSEKYIKMFILRKSSFIN
jgi:hypothetical protein